MSCLGKSLLCWSGRRISISILLVTLLLVFGIGHRSFADDASDKAKADQEKAAREQMYRELYQSVDPARLETTVKDLGKYQSRIAGYPDDAKAAEYVETQFKTLGLTDVRHDDFDVTVPYDPGVDDPAQGAYAQIDAPAGGQTLDARSGRPSAK